MYLFFGIFFLLVLFFVCFNHWRRKKIIRKVCCLCMDEKCALLNDLIEPFGYSYILCQDIFTSRVDAWQRDFGYCALYDKAASRFNMIFDCLPVYFDYQGRTWLIEFWKGQYGINTGCEIGVYYADQIIAEDEQKRTLFQCVDDQDMQNLSFTLLRKNENIAHLKAVHWWLTAFDMGCFSEPSDLTLCAALNFQSSKMAAAFAEGLLRAGVSQKDIYICHTTVSFRFSEEIYTIGYVSKLRVRIAQTTNRLLCKLYLYVTRPFDLSVDRLLYLYYYLPFAFRRVLRIRKYKKRRKKKG